ncbi:hypothetical protein TNCV_2348851 [Trichonephila clavipes]|uniref:Uncharacterized protein n=1 Tax=Trichonephila clavipes TaxID=2585209 RepID=A0A8X6SR94_TRICX|nr:hypothetical protein TNCV_2348851 [Trichonephila clavipes]
MIDVRDSSLGVVRHLTGGSGHEDLWGAEEMTSSRWRDQQSRCRKFPSSREKNHNNWSKRFNNLKDNERRRKQHSRSFIARREPRVLTLGQS